MATLREQCSVCGDSFDVVFRYQMEERDGAFAFFCSQDCLGASQIEGSDDQRVTCDACAKRFTVSLASQVLYLGGKRRYACVMACRSQLVRESTGTPLGEIAAQSAREELEAPEVDEGEAGDAEASDVEARDGVRPVAAVERGAPAAAPRGGAPAISRQREPSADRAKVASGRRAPQRIAVFNHKGGTGKTTTSVSLAAGLADRGHRVLLVDTDSQGNVAVSLGCKAERSLYHVLVMGLPVRDAVQSVRPGLDLLPSNETLAAAELYLAGRQNRDRVLSQRMGTAVEDYDYLIIDCSPSLSLMNQNALTLADSVLVPVSCDYLSLVGVRQVIKTVKNVNKLLRHPLQIWGVLPTFYDARARICTEALGTLKGHFGERCLAPIRATTKLKEAPAQARSIFEHAPGTHGAEDYATLVDAVLDAREDRAQTEGSELAVSA